MFGPYHTVFIDVGWSHNLRVIYLYIMCVCEMNPMHYVPTFLHSQFVISSVAGINKTLNYILVASVYCLKCGVKNSWLTVYYFSQELLALNLYTENGSGVAVNFGEHMAADWTIQEVTKVQSSHQVSYCRSMHGLGLTGFESSVI